MEFSPRLIRYVPMIINNHRVVINVMVDATSILLWTLAVTCFVITCVPKIRALPLYSLNVILAIGGIVCSLNEYTAGNIDNFVSLAVTVTMVSIMIYSLFYTLMEITPEMDRGRW